MHLTLTFQKISVDSWYRPVLVQANTVHAHYNVD